ncbi:MAG: glutamate synthase-related protein [Eubacteriales bacterium]|nr:glutamate synthase-related protein [Eubacteriales bacterium]MDD4391015.1 glutamate synthase-related protein [Eubacteriales bacterium]
MSYSPTLSSGFAATQNKSKFITPVSGICSLCDDACIGPCELGLAAVLGAQTVYPTTTGPNQIASEKIYPIDYSHFNINGRVFGASGSKPTYEDAAIYNVKLESEYGTLHKVKSALPIILPALIKLNWKDYFGGAAMAGVTCIIGEDAKSKDKALIIKDGKIVDFPFLKEALDSFNKYYRGYGQIVPQCNVEDDFLGVPEIAIQKYGAEAIEFKFGQSAKGTQPAVKLANIDEALAKKEMGWLVHPNPEDTEVKKAYSDGVCPNFYMYGRLPLWDEEFFEKRIAALRSIGMKNVYFKMAGFDSIDIERVLRIASKNDVDMVTFDGAGGGSGYSPCKMMNEWGLPTVVLESKLVDIVGKLKREGLCMPAITITGGFTAEDNVFKALALGGGDINAVGLCRASMAAAITGKNIGDAIKSDNIPAHLIKYGASVQEIFADLPDLRALYGKEANDFSTGAIGVFSYLNKIAFGIKHFAALNRKFDVKLFNKDDLIPLTKAASDLL